MIESFNSLMRMQNIHKQAPSRDIAKLESIRHVYSVSYFTDERW